MASIFCRKRYTSGEVLQLPDAIPSDEESADDIESSEMKIVMTPQIFTA